MKIISIFILFVIYTSGTYAQQNIYSVNAYDFQKEFWAFRNDPVQNRISLDKEKYITLPLEMSRTIIMQNSVGNTVNIYGKSLVIEEIDHLRDGSVTLVMRQENGKDFFNFFPKVKTRIFPQGMAAPNVSRTKKNSISEINNNLFNK